VHVDEEVAFDVRALHCMPDFVMRCVCQLIELASRPVLDGTGSGRFVTLTAPRLLTDIVAE
jgi:hypothetical protein